jgi:hypothetical protein
MLLSQLSYSNRRKGLSAQFGEVAGFIFHSPVFIVFYISCHNPPPKLQLDMHLQQAVARAHCRNYSTFDCHTSFTRVPLQRPIIIWPTIYELHI